MAGGFGGESAAAERCAFGIRSFAWHVAATGYENRGPALVTNAGVGGVGVGVAVKHRRERAVGPDAVEQNHYSSGNLSTRDCSRDIRSHDGHQNS